MNSYFPTTRPFFIVYRHICDTSRHWDSFNKLERLGVQGGNVLPIWSQMVQISILIIYMRIVSSSVSFLREGEGKWTGRGPLDPFEFLKPNITFTVRQSPTCPEPTTFLKSWVSHPENTVPNQGDPFPTESRLTPRLLRDRPRRDPVGSPNCLRKVSVKRLSSRVLSVVLWKTIWDLNFGSESDAHNDRTFVICQGQSGHPKEWVCWWRDGLNSDTWDFLGLLLYGGVYEVSRTKLCDLSTWTGRPLSQFWRFKQKGWRWTRGKDW